MNCLACGGKGMLKGCDCCGVSREMTDQERQYAEWDRQDEARKACQVYATSTATCSHGTRGCPLHHGR